MLEKPKINDRIISIYYECFDSVDRIPTLDWNAVSCDQLFLSIPYLEALERSLSATIDFKYLLFYVEETPVAIAVTQLVRFNTSEVAIQEFPCFINETLGNKIVKNLDVRILVCGNIFTCGEHGFAYTDKIAAKEAFKMLAKTLREIRKSESKNKPSFLLVKEFWPDTIPESDTLLDQKFRPIHIDVNMVVTIQDSWNSFDDYLASMKTKFRTRAKKVLATSAGLEIKDFDLNMISKYENEIDQLYLSVIENADFKIAQLSAKAFSALKEALKEAFVFKGYFLEDKLVGFSTAFILKCAVEASHIGIDYAYNVSHSIYQRMLYDYADLAIMHKVRSLRLGRTAELIKSSIGAQAVPMRLYVRHGNSISNKLLKPMVELVQPSPYELRTPFKA